MVMTLWAHVIDHLESESGPGLYWMCVRRALFGKPGGFKVKRPVPGSVYIQHRIRVCHRPAGLHVGGEVIHLAV
jgi:hypothetical protein